MSPVAKSAVAYQRALDHSLVNIDKLSAGWMGRMHDITKEVAPAGIDPDDVYGVVKKEILRWHETGKNAL